MPEYRCYWKVMKPETKVAVAFGTIGARRYGRNMTLWQGIRGRVEAYRTLLREGITALLNSYNNLQFPYNTSSVIQHFNWALMGTRKYVLHTALRFKRANSDDGHLRCKFTRSVSLFFCLLTITDFVRAAIVSDFSITEATVENVLRAFSENRLTSRQLVDLYLRQIETFNPLLRSVLEVNPDVLVEADKADQERQNADPHFLGPLHGIPVLLKDSIGTKDKLNTTAGSYALLGSKVPRDAFVVERLRKAGALILGKASQTEWYKIRSFKIPDGWCARGGQALNPYVHSASPCGSSSGSAISVAANMVTVSLGTETDRSIICPADANSVVGLKPSVGLTSRAGVIPVALRLDTIGPICRTVSDAVRVLEVIVGFDPKDYEATKTASRFIPSGGYMQFLKVDGLLEKKLGVVRKPFLDSYDATSVGPIFEHNINLLSRRGAIIVDNLEIKDIDIILNPSSSGELQVMLADFKVDIKDYLEELIDSPVRSLADILKFNLNHSQLEKTTEYGQDMFEKSELTNGIGDKERKAIKRMQRLSKNGFEKLMKDNQLDALVTVGSKVATVLAIGGFPAITVPAGYDSQGMPFGFCFGGLKDSEPKLIEIAYAFEQATLMRKPPVSPSLDIKHCKSFKYHL